MNLMLLAAALLATLSTAAHVLIGGTLIAAPLMASTLQTEPRLVLYACWHGITAAMALSAIGFFLGALPRFAASGRMMVAAISVWWLAITAVLLAVIAAQPGDGLLWRLPQWVWLAPVGFLGLAASLRPSRRAAFP